MKRTGVMNMIQFILTIPLFIAVLLNWELTESPNEEQWCSW
jgi:hypothetical protein